MIAFVGQHRGSQLGDFGFVIHQQDQLAIALCIQDLDVRRDRSWASARGVCGFRGGGLWLRPAISLAAAFAVFAQGPVRTAAGQR